jgi:acetyl-CoA C-acetyltransferase
MQREIVVVSAVRTPVGSFGGSLKSIPPCELAASVVREAMRRIDLDPAKVDHTIFGNVIHTEPRDMYLGRVASVNGGIPVGTPALTLNRLCGSGLQAVISAAQQIASGNDQIAVAGGAENMSRAPYWAPDMRWGARMGDMRMIDTMVAALTDPFEKIHMGITAENVAARYHISREDQDKLAVQSHQRAARATDNGYFSEQILPVEVKSRKMTICFNKDEHIRYDANLADMAKLKPVFKKDGTVTAGNASGLNDGAAALVLAEAGEARQLGLKPLARLAGYAHAAVEPEYMGIGPIPAIRILLQRAGLAVDAIDLYEINEAFAAQALAVVQELELPKDRVNPNGSGVSLGHPLAATGAVLSVKAIYELHRTGGRYAVVSMCIGGGQGIAALYERM